jgi:hypothetical protein
MSDNYDQNRHRAERIDVPGGWIYYGGPLASPVLVSDPAQWAQTNDSIAGKLDRVLDSLSIIHQELHTIMASLSDILTDVTDEGTAIAGISTLVAGLRQQIADALSGTTLPPAVQTQIDAIFTQAEANKAAIATALAANTPTPAAP